MEVIKNYHELRQNVSRSRRRSLSSSYDFDFEMMFNTALAAVVSRKYHDFDNEDHVEAKLHKLALATHNDSTDTSSDESSGSSSMSDSSSGENSRKVVKKKTTI